ncbi:MAG: ubiquitin fusion degradation Ufd1 [Lasallia pustulata]|uniref:Ubiquitin fusion degradation protein 1 n=1 Tax=Lasallia pustulata TaxID=136370 RepID=A0A5M8PMI6_9LECA|nr:MAG: ubiquitin fusion degradation Ufd1 [Lasallia pustulata]
MFGGYYDEDTMMGGGMYPSAIMRRAATTPARRFDEYYRCYPVVMLPGPERDNVNHGGKVIMPPSALDKLTRLEITYPMLFELINGAKERMTHAGVLEFIAEEGKIYLPFWIMQTLLLEQGDLLQIKSTDLPSGQFIKLQAQSTSFLDISDPKAVLENAFRNFSCLSKGDIFTFAYNDQTYEMAVLETKPETAKNAISVLETDLEVDFAAPLGYEEPKRPSGTSTPRSTTGGLPAGGMLHNQGTMAQAINYASIAPASTTAAAGAKAMSSNFLLGGQKLSAKKGSKAPTPNASTPVAGASTNAGPTATRRTNGRSRCGCAE